MSYEMIALLFLLAVPILVFGEGLVKFLHKTYLRASIRFYAWSNRRLQRERYIHQNTRKGRK